MVWVGVWVPAGGWVAVRVVVVLGTGRGRVSGMSRVAVNAVIRVAP